MKPTGITDVEFMTETYHVDVLTGRSNSYAASVPEIDPNFFRLERMIERRKRILISFSGGLDSSVLAKVSVDVLGRENAKAVMVVSEFIAKRDIESAIAVSREIGIELRIERCTLLNGGPLSGNPPDRCYHCKRAVSEILRSAAGQYNIKCIGDGHNLSDLGAHRPGVRASDEAGIWHPFLEADIDKGGIRRYARAKGLSVYGKPSDACLATRIPYGDEITPEKLARIGRGEAFLMDMGFSCVRLRTYGRLARIEVPPLHIPELMESGVSGRVVEVLRSMGYTHVAVDLMGYRTGSMDEDGIGSVDEDGIGSVDEDGIGSVDEDGIGSMDEDGIGSMDEDGIGSVDEDGTGSVDKDGTGSMDKDGIRIPEA